MKFRANINIMPRPELLDPQGKATMLGLKNLGLAEVDDIRIGKRIQLDIEADSRTDAEAKVEESCKKLLANLIMESYEFELQELS
ncbi:MAG: phosphoribosylformylglycinamidine synthase subunit PurS [Bacteroidota bacterium]